MGTNPLIYLLGGALLLFMGLKGLRDRQVYLGRLIRLIGPKLIFRGRISVLVYGILISLAGVLAMFMSIVTLENPESDIIEQIGPYAVLALFAGLFGSMVVEFIYHSAGWPPYDEPDEEVDEEDSFRDILR